MADKDFEKLCVDVAKMKPADAAEVIRARREQISAKITALQVEAKAHSDLLKEHEDKLSTASPHAETGFTIAPSDVGKLSDVLKKG